MAVHRVRVRWLGAVAGLVAAAVALAAAEVVARLVGGQSLVVAIGGVIVDSSPRSLSGAAIETFGTSDKPALLVGIVVAALALGAAMGPLAMRSRAAGIASLAGFALAGGVSGASDPFTSVAQAFAAALAGWLAGSASLLLLLRAATAAAGVEAAGVREAPGTPTVRRAPRRQFLALAGGGLAAAALSVLLGRRLIGPSVDVEAQRTATTLPRPSVRPVATTPAEAAPVAASPVASGSPAVLDFEGVSPLVTPNRDFYRIDTALSVPHIDSEQWRLRITGMVDRPAEFTFAELLAMRLQEESVTLACVSNHVGGDLVGNAEWLGVPLPALLARAGLQAGATQIVGRSVDGFTVGFPTDVALDGRQSMVVFGMNGEPLPAEHGFPARLIVPGLYGYVSATKWLGEIELTRLDAFDSYWVARGWAQKAPIKLQSRIDVPRGDATVSAGLVHIGGVAWGGLRGVSAVEVRARPRDAEEAAASDWMAARVGAELSDSSWRQWVAEWPASPGDYDLEVRATDRGGLPQAAAQHPPFPDGATGYHRIRVGVEAA